MDIGSAFSERGNLLGYFRSEPKSRDGWFVEGFVRLAFMLLTDIGALTAVLLLSVPLLLLVGTEPTLAQDRQQEETCPVEDEHGRSCDDIIMSSDAGNKYTKEELKERLTSMQYWVTQEHGTEKANSGEYVNLKDDGNYYCVVCGGLLFSSKSKYNSGSGWPAFSDIAEQSTVETSIDSSHGMVRTEVKCAKCKAHLGHMFEDGPQPSGLRYCVNSASLKFEGTKP